MILNCLENRINRGYITFGSVWDKGEVCNPFFALNDACGKSIPVQSKATAWWPDKSIKWAAHVADSALMGKTAAIVPAKVETVFAGTALASFDGNFYSVNTGKLRACIPANFPAVSLIENISLENKTIVSKVYPVFRLERRRREDASFIAEDTAFHGHVNSVSLEENGPLSCVFRFDGVHIPGASVGCSMPFAVWGYFYYNSAEIRFTHTWFYDGKEDRDFLKGMGICFETTLDGEAYNRHVKFGIDQFIENQFSGKTNRCFHEAAVMMNSWRPNLPQSVLESQMSGIVQHYSKGSDEETAANDLPIWNRYILAQDSSSHFAIRKQTEEKCCVIDCMHGSRAPGIMSVTGNGRGIMLAVKDFWQKHPSGLEIDGLNGLNGGAGKCFAWFYSPEAAAFDFRHYAARSYPQSSYEGFDDVNAAAYGVAVTGECTLSLVDCFPSDETVSDFALQVQKPPFYFGTPEYYHEKKAFGFWSLQKTETETEAWLEKQLDKAVSFYIHEVENRNWYGFFNYGDIMHTYDNVRHSWRYDMGGYAWQNTELVPTYCLWLYFLRTVREDIFTLAEAMSRHCSEVDFYHFGALKGIGSRHNVRHWGCPCKEPRISMSGHHRFYYYLTGDNRIGEAMNDAADADVSMKNCIHFVEKNKDGKEQVVVRSGPDWSSFVSNWMTKYERTLDPAYRRKIETGINDIAKTPFGLSSGPYFVYDSDDSALVCLGENDRAGMHLQICMGGPQVWLETAYMLDHGLFKKMLADHGKFYFFSKEEKSEKTNGLIFNRSFSYPYFAAGLGAYSAFVNNDSELAGKIWKEIFQVIVNNNGESGLQTKTYAFDSNGKNLEEFTWINRSGLSTNYLMQWSLNVIMALDFIREYLPASLEVCLDKKPKLK